jgi:hypothetical protein
MVGKIARVMTGVLISAAVLVPIATPAHANPAGCTIDYVSTVSSPPPGTQVVYIDNDKLKINEVRVRPGETVALVNHVSGSTVAYVTCVV